MRVEHKVALISGGARGMGAAEAKLFATERANVVVGDVLARIPHLAQTSDAVNRQLSCFSSRYMNPLAVFQI